MISLVIDSVCVSKHRQRYLFLGRLRQTLHKGKVQTLKLLTYLVFNIDTDSDTRETADISQVKESRSSWVDGRRYTEPVYLQREPERGLPRLALTAQSGHPCPRTLIQFDQMPYEASLKKAIVSTNKADLFFPVLLSHRNSDNEQLILGRYDEDVILPCLFTSGSQVVIHWKNQDNYVHSYYSGEDQLENQDFRYANRTSLVPSEISNGNASLTVRRLSLQDEGIYICYVGTTSTRTRNTVVLKVGAFHTPLIRYEKRDTESLLVCSIPSVYPYPHITWKMDNKNVSYNILQETGAPGPFNISSTLNITGSNSSFECTIENSLLNQTWRGEWTLAGSHRKNESDSISLWCITSHIFSLLNQDFQVSWSKVVNGAPSILDWHPNSSQDTTTNDPQFSGNKELRYFSLMLKDLHASDSGEYLCNVSSTDYTLLTVHRLHVAQDDAFEVFYFLINTMPPAAWERGFDVSNNTRLKSQNRYPHILPLCCQGNY
ncbi:hypothetical protein U0070_000217, partial [Myodes glareolus]